MNLFKKIFHDFNENLSLNKLLRILVIIVIIYIITISSGIWLAILRKLQAVFLPFAVGFAIAYIVRPLIIWLERFKIRRKFIVPLLVIFVIGLLTWIFASLIPTFYNDIFAFIGSLVESVTKFYDWYVKFSGNVPSPIVAGFTESIVKFLNDYTLWMPNVSAMVPQFVGNLATFLVNFLFSFIVAIYVMFDYENITKSLLKVAKSFADGLPDYIIAIDDEVSVYLRSLIVLMLIKFVEYSFLYYLIGHHNWLILGVLTAIGLLIPYFGASMANVIGIITALSLPTSNVVILIIAITILSNVDEYVITPMVHSRRGQVQPLWTLFSVFAGGIMFGPVGIMFAVPTYMSIRTVIRLYRLRNEPNDSESSVKTNTVF